jgi:TRAP-type C4-dicarboxylate transport system permease small subunit
MLPEVAFPQVAALLVLLGLALVICAMGWRWWATVGTGGQRDVGVASIFRIMVGVAGGIVLAMVLLLVLTAALAR